MLCRSFQFHNKIDGQGRALSSTTLRTMSVQKLRAALLSVENWRTSKAFLAMAEKETQLRYYKSKEAAPEVMALVDLDSKPFGSVCESMLVELFGLGPRTSSQNDGTRLNKKIEIKCARYWAGKDDCKWQHLEADHDYEFALFALLDFHGWKVWGIKKSLLMGELREKKVVTFQGKQGWWAKKSALIPYLTEIQSQEQLDALLQAA